MSNTAIQRIEPLAVKTEAEPTRSSAPCEVGFGSGRRVSLAEDEREQIVVRSPSGQVELAIRFTEAGPVLTFEAASISMRAAGAIDLQCARFQVQAREAAELASGGTLALSAGTDVVVVGQNIWLN